MDGATDIFAPPSPPVQADISVLKNVVLVSTIASLDPALDNSNESLLADEPTVPAIGQSSATDVSQLLIVTEGSKEKLSVSGITSVKAEVEAPKNHRKKSSSRKKTPVAYDPQGEEASDTSDGESDGYFVNVAADNLNATGLYEAYREKLKREDWHPTTHKKSAPKLVENFVRYLQNLEDRIDQLESAEQMNNSEESEAEGKAEKDTKPQDKGKMDEYVQGNEEKKDDKKSEEPEKPPEPTFKVEKMFYRWDNPRLKDSFDDKNVQRQYCIKAAYTLKLGKEARLDPAEQMPPAENIQIDMIVLRSEPIKHFLEAKVDFPQLDGLEIRVARPFRLLVRNINKFREQLVVLQTRQKDGESVKEKGDIPAHGVESDDQFEAAPASPIDGKGEAEGNEEGGETKAEPLYEKVDAIEHFKLLISFLEEYLAIPLKKWETIRSRKQSRISFEDLWMLFDCGETICCPYRKGGISIGSASDDDNYITIARDTPQAYRVVATTGGVPLNVEPQLPKFKSKLRKSDLTPPKPVQARDAYSALSIDCYYLDYDGSRYDCVADKFYIKPYEGELDVTSLEVFPIGFDSNIDKEFFTKRGTKFLEYSYLFSHKHYEGLTVGASPEEVNSPVIVDFLIAFQDDRRRKPVFSYPKKGLKKNEKQSSEVTGYICKDGSTCPYCNLADNFLTYQNDQLHQHVTRVKDAIDQYQDVVDSATRKPIEAIKKQMDGNSHIMLLPGVVYAFALRNRRWFSLDIDHIQDMRVDEAGFNDLVLPTGHQNMVLSMVNMHTVGSRSTTGKAKTYHDIDLVRGKGKGMIILLHGEPGVGKTSTAECVAAHTGRPLFPITCGDIGGTAEDVEKNLEQHFNLAHKWGCVLLLDEADVFLEKRNKGDLQRNGVVSVFLRVLEYYPGILFLTTNRIGSFDPGFRSRIHLSLYYPSLDKDKTTKIWKNNLRRVEKNNEKRKNQKLRSIEFDEDEILNFARDNFDKLNWNGRQIRNAFQTAIALAEFKAEELTKKNSKSRKTVTITVHDFYIVAKAASEFDEYLTKTLQGEEGDLAHKEKLRAYKFKAVKTKELVKPKKNDDESESSADSEDASEAGDKSVMEDFE